MNKNSQVLVFLSSQPLYQRNYDRFGIDILKKMVGEYTILNVVLFLEESSLILMEVKKKILNLKI